MHVTDTSRLLEGEPSSNFGCEITVLTAFFIVFCSPCRMILCWYIRIYQTMPQFHHSESSYHGSFITAKLKKCIQHNKIPEYANRSTEDQLHFSAFLCWSYFIFMLDKDLFQTCRQSMDVCVIIDQTPEN